MRVLVVVAAAVSMVAVCALEGKAQDYSKAPKPHVKGQVGNAKPDPDNKIKYPDAKGWYPHDSSKLAYGSAIWWEQMQREGRLGGDVK
jgi:hypothetical protein